MIGSSFVALTTLYPIENRRKVGKTLLFWLSFSDFFSSFVYFVQVFNRTGANNAYCRAIGLLGIFFPVSSFIWTDLIAYYLFSVIVQRNQADSAAHWDQRLKYCHMVAWGVPAIIVTIVGLAHKVGQTTGNSWCWIEPQSNPNVEFGWELVGGKFVEWVSCFVILPTLYAYAACQLHKIEINTDKPLVNTIENIRNKANRVPQIQSPSAPAQSSKTSPREGVLLSSLEGTLHLTPGVTSDTRNSAVVIPNKTSFSGGGGGRRVRLFGRFYLKMAAVPIVFFLIRFWGSLRVVWIYAAPARPTESWLRTMIDIFDPSQGFFNAVLFVMLSRDGQRSVLLAFSLFVATCLYFIPGAIRFSMWLEKLSRRKHMSAVNSAGVGGGVGGGGGGNGAGGAETPRFSKYNRTNFTNTNHYNTNTDTESDLNNPLMLSAGGNDLSTKEEEDEIEYGGLYSFAASQSQQSQSECASMSHSSSMNGLMDRRGGGDENGDDTAPI